MSEIKWIKINTDMFDDEKIKLIEGKDSGLLIVYVWIRLLVCAGKLNDGGKVYLNKEIPYTPNSLSIIYNKPSESIKNALKELEDLRMIEIDKNKTIRIINWEKHQNVEGMERARELSKLRMRKKRAKDKALLENNINVTNSNSYVTDDLVTLQNNNIEREENKDRDNKEKQIDNIKDIELDLNDKNENIKSIDAIAIQASKILKYYEDKTKVKNIFNISSLKVAIAKHGYMYVNLAIEKALDNNKPNMRYVNGILKIWKEEGYPNLKEGVVNGEGKSMLSTCCDVEEFK